MRIAFIGMGIMGRPMAANLVKAGHEVTVWNRTPGKAPAGAREAASAREAAREAEVVWMCVPDTAAVEQALLGPQGVEASLKPGMVVVDSSTISPEATQRFAERVRARGADYLDAPLTGSKAAAEGGTLIFIVGGSEAAIEKLHPLWGAMGKQVIRMGGTGMGQGAKLGLNLMIALMYESFAEALTLTRRLGVAPDSFLDLLRSSMARSGVLDYKAPFVERRDFSANFPLRLMHKDLHLILDAAKQHGVRLPGVEGVDTVYEAASQEGHDDLDYAATLLLIEKWAGMEKAA
ncbi:MAG TPA: NAD(P)-dependent oxidoreductase [Terriglobales bacterium]|nr:NAD(P)-dependent oxidoreductase [Terriglobales bacterium]